MGSGDLSKWTKRRDPANGHGLIAWPGSSSIIHGCRISGCWVIEPRVQIRKPGRRDCPFMYCMGGYVICGAEQDTKESGWS